MAAPAGSIPVNRETVIVAVVVLGVIGAVALVIYLMVEASKVTRENVGDSKDPGAFTCDELKDAYNAGDGTALREALAREPVCPWAQAILDQVPTCDEFRRRWCEAKRNHAYTDMARAAGQARYYGCPDVDKWTCP